MQERQVLTYLVIAVGAVLLAAVHSAWVAPPGPEFTDWPEARALVVQVFDAAAV